jgi:hypothetical protein
MVSGECELYATLGASDGAVMSNTADAPLLSSPFTIHHSPLTIHRSQLIVLICKIKTFKLSFTAARISRDQFSL